MTFLYTCLLHTSGRFHMTLILARNWANEPKVENNGYEFMIIEIIMIIMGNYVKQSSSNSVFKPAQISLIGHTRTLVDGKSRETTYACRQQY